MSGATSALIGDVSWAVIQLAAATVCAVLATGLVVCATAFVYFQILDWRDSQQWTARERARVNSGGRPR